MGDDVTYSIGFIGTGDPDGDGFGMAYHHAKGYQQRSDCEIIACADLIEEHAQKFADEHSIPDSHVYSDYEEMLDETAPDIISICVPPAVHAPVTIDCIQSGAVDAIHCEKPMASTWGECKDMAVEADRHGVQLTFNHQRRFAPEWRHAKELLDTNQIGELTRVETAAPDLFDWGTHCVDLCGMFVDEAAPKWVLGNIEASEEHIVYGIEHENQGLGLWEYENGIFGTISTGGEGGHIDCGFIDALHRLRGTDGVIEVNPQWGNDLPSLRIKRAGETSWSAVDVQECEETQHDVAGAVDHAVSALDEGFEPEIGVKNALKSTELIFGIYESSRRRGRVEFPLDITDHPLASMLESGEINRTSDR